MFPDTLIWTHDEQLLATNDTLPLASPKFPDNGTQMLSLILLDGSAHTLLHRTTITEHILPSLGQASEAFYVMLVYGDYPPSSEHVVETVYTGGSMETLIEAVNGWEFQGGTPIRNALHEGLAACLETMGQIDLENVTLTIIANSFPYEEFHKSVHTRSTAGYSGKAMGELLTILQDRRVNLNFFWPMSELAVTTLRIIQQSLGVEGGYCDKVQLPDRWCSKTFAFDTYQPRSAKSIGGSSDELQKAELPSATSPLEATVRQFLAAVLKLPQNQRAEAIKRHLESPAYSTEYKQCLIVMVRQMQNTTRRASPPSALPPTRHEKAGPSKPSLPNVIQPALNPPVKVNTGAPMWRGRMAYRTHTEQFYFDVSAISIANPKCSNPHQIPPTSEFQVQNWPLVLAISSFISVQSPAVAKSVPIAKLVDLQPLGPDGAPVPINEASLALRNLLVNRQIVGLVRLGATHAMLIAARPYQLVGMVISKQAASALTHKVPGAQQQTTQRSTPILTHQVHPEPSVHSPPLAHNAHKTPALTPPVPMVELLTPDAILRQRQSRMRSSEPFPASALAGAINTEHSVHSNGSSNLDVFNALMTDFDTEMGGPMEDGLSPFDYLDFSSHTFPQGNEHQL